VPAGLPTPKHNRVTPPSRPAASAVPSHVLPGSQPQPSSCPPFFAHRNPLSHPFLVSQSSLLAHAPAQYFISSLHSPPHELTDPFSPVYRPCSCTLLLTHTCSLVAHSPLHCWPPSCSACCSSPCVSCMLACLPHKIGSNERKPINAGTRLSGHWLWGKQTIAVGGTGEAAAGRGNHMWLAGKEELGRMVLGDRWFVLLVSGKEASSLGSKMCEDWAVEPGAYRRGGTESETSRGQPQSSNSGREGDAARVRQCRWWGHSTAASQLH
jgi:hypothetical protein